MMRALKSFKKQLSWASASKLHCTMLVSVAHMRNSGRQLLWWESSSPQCRRGCHCLPPVLALPHSCRQQAALLQLVHHGTQQLREQWALCRHLRYRTALWAPVP